MISSKTSYAAKLIWKGDDVSGCRAILGDSPFGPEQFQFGKTKVFIRTPESLFALEDLRINYYQYMTSRIKNAYRNWKAYKHDCVSRIKNAFKNFRAFKIQCVKIVQKCYRDYKNVAPYSELRMKVEPYIQGKKERNRLSVASVRKFFGDYLKVASRGSLVSALGPTFGLSFSLLFFLSHCDRWIIIS